jgi:tol-pal system protein YbgF
MHANKIWPKSHGLIRGESGPFGWRVLICSAARMNPQFSIREMLMYFRTLLSGTLAALFLSVAAAGAASPGADDGATIERQSTGLPGVFDAPSSDGSYQTAQAADPRVMQLEEQVRKLSGTIEELNFQVLQLQEQIRKLQEDYDFRLQELEKKSGLAGKSNTSVATDTTTNPAVTAGSSQDESVEDVIANDTTNATGAEAGNGAAGGTLGEPPQDFGVITVDKDGNVKSVETGTTESTASSTLPAENGSATQGGGSIVAALPPTDDPEELYRNSYQFILSGDYSTAEAGFRDHIERFPKNERAADARFWLGEAQLGQKKYRDAAETFLTASKQYPKAKKAPDTLLKLGISLAGLKQRDVACATFAEVGKRYPNASAALKERVKQEQALASC